MCRLQALLPGRPQRDEERGGRSFAHAHAAVSGRSRRKRPWNAQPRRRRAPARRPRRRRGLLARCHPRARGRPSRLLSARPRPPAGEVTGVRSTHVLSRQRPRPLALRCASMLAAATFGLAACGSQGPHAAHGARRARDRGHDPAPVRDRDDREVSRAPSRAIGLPVRVHRATRRRRVHASRCSKPTRMER